MMDRPKVSRCDALPRTLLTWVLVVALVCGSPLSLHAHAAQQVSDHGTAPAVHAIDTGCDHQPGGDSVDHARHCSCQHFGGIVVPVVAIAPRQGAAERIVSVLPPRITHPPAAPHRPPIA